MKYKSGIWAGGTWLARTVECCRSREGLEQGLFSARDGCRKLGGSGVVGAEWWSERVGWDGEGWVRNDVGGIRG
jgi:hypothetical protein